MGNTLAKQPSMFGFFAAAATFSLLLVKRNEFIFMALKPVMTAPAVSRMLSASVMIPTGEMQRNNSIEFQNRECKPR
jgi:hypothetical protein